MLADYRKRQKKRGLIMNFTTFKNNLLFFKREIPACMTEEFFNQFKKWTQANRVLWFLKEYGDITGKEINILCKTEYPSDPIRKLRKRGINIVNVNEKGLNGFDQNCNYVRYTLVDDKIEECA